MSKANAISPASLVHPDPLVDEIRAIKQRVSAAAGHDVRTLCTQLEHEQASQRRLLADRAPRINPRLLARKGTESIQFYTQQKMTMTRWFESAKDSAHDPVWKQK